jgi:GT2 family glycosyltransferase
VDKAIVRINAEIIIVDNNSTDGSREHLPSKFPGVKFIFNNENLGFAKACN